MANRTAVEACARDSDFVDHCGLAETLRNLADPRYADYAALFGFKVGVYPTEGSLRYFLTALGRHSEVDGDTIIVEREGEEPVEVAIQYLNQFLVGAVTLIREGDLL